MHAFTSDLRQQVASHELARQQRIRNAWLAYHGETPGCLKRRPNAPDDNVTINYARAVVDRGISFLLGGGVLIRVAARDAAKAQEWLDRAWASNSGHVLLHRLALNGAVCGQTFLKIVPADAPHTPPRLVVLDPAAVSVTWLPDDWETVVRYEIAYHGWDHDAQQPVAFRQIIQRRPAADTWTITDQRSEGDSAEWRTTRTQTWPYPWPPIVTCQNLPAPNEFWGLSDLEPDVLALCRTMSCVLSNANRIVRLHAHPKLWGSGFQPDELSLDPDDVTILPIRDAALHLLEMRGDLAPSLELYRRLKDALHELTGVPEISAGALQSLGRVSGVALRVLYQPLVERTRTKRLMYGQLIRQTSQRILQLAGFGPDLPIELDWPAPAPADPYEEARTALLHTQLGMPAEQALARLGLTPRKDS